MAVDPSAAAAEAYTSMLQVTHAWAAAGATEALGVVARHFPRAGVPLDVGALAVVVCASVDLAVPEKAADFRTNLAGHLGVGHPVADAAVAKDPFHFLTDLLLVVNSPPSSACITRDLVGSITDAVLILR